MSYESKLAEMKEMVSHIEYMKYSLNSIMFWDKITYMPEAGIEYRSKEMAYMADIIYRMLNDRKFIDCTSYFNGNPKNDVVTDSMVKRIKRNSEYINKIPEDKYSAYIRQVALSEQAWSKARQQNDFDIFKPYLKNMIEYFKVFPEYWGYKDEPYDALLGYYEEDLNVKVLEKSVSSIKGELISMIKFESENERNREPEIIVSADSARQKMLWQLILKKIGFNFKAGRIDIGDHSTILANSPSDVRIVNAYNETDIRDGIFNTLHAGGKGVYQQSIDPSLLGTFLAEAPSNTLEEAVGRFYENIIGRSKGFWDYIYDEATAIIPELDCDSDSKASLDEFYRSINIHKPTMIRLDADELTYLIHIIIRYEIERDLISDRLKIDDLEEAWMEKYKGYLGIIPSDDREGVLQDIHWASGYFGYFPTYIISNLAAAQFAAAIEKEKGDIEDLIRQGRIGEITEWMQENIYKFGATYNSSELIRHATGEELDPGYYLDYLHSKISK